MVSLISVINQGFIFSLVAIAVYITSRIIQKDDLSVAGSFGLGGAITAVVIERTAYAWPAVIIAIIAGALLGACTGLLFTRLKMNHLMAGLVSSTGCFSIALALASSNKIVKEEHTVFSLLSSSPSSLAEASLLAFISCIILLSVRFVIRSDLGLLMRCVGENPQLLTHLGKSKSTYYCLGFIIANAITAVAGSLFVQWSGFFSITGNIGVLVTGLATLMFAELFDRSLGFGILLAASLYQGIFLVTLELGIDPIFNNLIKAIVMVLLVIAARAATRRNEHA